MGTACSEPEIPLDKNYNPYANMGPPSLQRPFNPPSVNLSNKITSAFENKKFPSTIPSGIIESVSGH